MPYAVGVRHCFLHHCLWPADHSPLLHSNRRRSSRRRTTTRIERALYGTTYGDYDYLKKELYGSIFEISTAGKFKNLYTFCSLANCADGEYPRGALIQAPNGNLYGTTLGGGAYNGGTVFELTPGGKLTTLYSFCAQANCADGQAPQNPLVLAPNGRLYGTSYYGGPYCIEYGGCGTVFELTTSGKLTTLHQFCSTQPNCPDGFTPSPLILASDGSLYGTTFHDGAYDLSDGAGTIFKLTAGGKLTTLYSFDNTSAQWPWTALLQATDGAFYGTTLSGSYPSDGTVFAFSAGLAPFVKTQPAFGKVGAAIVILGKNLTGATAVTFNGAAASFAIVSDTEITATVPSDATSGVVQVTTPSATLRSLPFIVTP